MSWLIVGPGLFRLSLAGAVILSHVSAIAVGRLGVMLFFFLSGFWVLHIWKERFGPGRTGMFYRSRYLRIIPIYALVLAAAALITGWSLRVETFTLFGVASAPLADPTGVSWSLDIELQFYLLLPLLTSLIARWPAGVTLAASLAAGALGLVVQERLGVVTVAFYLPAFMLGALVCEHEPTVDDRTALLSVITFAIVTAFALTTPFGRAMLDKHINDPMNEDVFAMLMMLPLLPYVIRSLARRSDSLDRHLGNITYPLYLVHVVVLAAAGGSSIPERMRGVVACVAVAVAVYVLFDRPVDAIRRRLFESSRIAPSPSVASEPESGVGAASS